MPISIGELIDKIIILKIRNARQTDPSKLVNIVQELNQLELIWNQNLDPNWKIEQSIEELIEVNESLWDIEDRLRTKEATECFDDEFIELARSAYRRNDQRA